MDTHALKIKRSNLLLKCLMALTLLLFVLQYSQTQVFDLGEFASTIAILAFLRGLLLSPFMLNTPMKEWFKGNVGFNKQSYQYFILALVLALVGSI
ncbi:hypothetical protein HII17_00660 [Thalassotalea sp. M1531]|uniref:Uncharacterized protein n=1 Tax=Thalassotalea algicola TaxID=2716224 RepID=A0A7Y0L9Q2_9GAMM|nr:hypothetical protein [Thalassotalea algicola]NMP30057.1 hypothetical protein [Thalassotalea algicola]